MSFTSGFSNVAGASTRPARHSTMAVVPATLSVFAFVLPVGIAAVVLGHVANWQIDASGGRLEGKATARAALIIGYVQMALVVASFGIAWQAVRGLQMQFRREAMVQSMIRDQNALAPLDAESARNEEMAAHSILLQLAATEDRSQQQSGGYICEISKLLAAGPDGQTPAEIQAFADRLRHSAYSYDLKDCADSGGPGNAAHYMLTAAPRLPQMPENSAIYCVDQTGVLRQVRSGTSLDCVAHGLAVE